jgi:lipopolysaccharide/colanic/teichoic acid biosynthesis glycosyltransferase
MLKQERTWMKRCNVNNNMKRLIDILMSSAALLVLFPLLVPVAVILRFSGENQVFYSQERVGYNGRIFGLLKFATMLKDSPHMGTGDITVKNDSRVLPFGRILRKTKINELPQLINVIIGDMSIIGPRPLTPGNFDYYSDETKRTIAKMSPGLSGVGSILFRDEESLMADITIPHDEFYQRYIAPYKGQLEMWYYQNQSMVLDMKLIALTMIVVLYPHINVKKYLKNIPTRS